MKIFTTEQLQEADRITLENQKITSSELMERAATLAFNQIDASLKGSEIPIKIFCGVGNNGGDGLVIARLLIEKKYDVKIFVVNYSDKRSEGFLANYERIKEITNDWPVLLSPTTDLPEISKDDFVIDSVFGIGLNRPLLSWVTKLFRHINASHAFILAVDIPSGLFMDRILTTDETAIKAGVTLTFQSPKLVFFLPQTAHFVGDFIVLDIGLDQNYLETTETATVLIGKQEAISFYRPREKFSHKGTYGHCLMVGGSHGKIGSMILSATAAFKAGAGKLSVWVPACGCSIVQTALPEAMVITSDDENHLVNREIEFHPEVICFGMGAGRHFDTVITFENILKNIKKPMVIDADGLNILAENNHLLKEIPKNSVLTPHPKELERLIGPWKDDFDKLEKAKAFAKKYEVNLVIKGAFSITLVKDNMFINSTGNPGMATAGSGDVLAGAIAGLVSQGYNPDSAAVFGVYLHGKAGDIAAGKNGFESMLAGDISNNLGAAFLDLFQHSTAPTQQP